MIYLKKYVLWIIKSAIAGTISILILSIFVLAYHYTGANVVNSSGATDFTGEAKQLKTTMIEGFSWIQLDENGFNNDEIHFCDEFDILLIGSSQMAAYEVAKNNSTGYLLNEMISDMNTYNIGAQGHTIYHCVNNIANAVEEYNPRNYVLLCIDTVELDIEKMQAVLNGKLERIHVYNNRLMYLFQTKLPAIKEVYKQLDEWWHASDNTGSDITEKIIGDYKSEDYTNTIMHFLKKAVSPISESRVKLIIFYHPPTELDEHGNLVDSTDPEALAAFNIACEQNGILFIDMTNQFQTLYENEHILAHGFCNTAVGSGHLNASGHRVIAERLKEVLQEDRNDVVE